MACVGTRAGPVVGQPRRAAAKGAPFTFLLSRLPLAWLPVYCTADCCSLNR
jgi:hypothetical protein